MPTITACIGHWYVSFIYAAPAILLAGALGFSTMREKRRKAAGLPPRRRMGARSRAAQSRVAAGR